MTGILDKHVQCSNVSETPKSKEDNFLEAMPSYTPGTLSHIAADSELEGKALRRFDIFLLPQLALVTILAYLDRTNLGNAKVFGLIEGLNLKGNEFNNLVTLFYVTYIICDVLWVVSIKKFGANRILGVAMVGWSAATLGTGFSKTYGQVMACRLLLGVFESGLLPGMIFIISTIWNREQQAKRVAVIYCSTTISGAFGGLIAYGIQTMGTQRGLEPWRWLFIIEGVISMTVGLIFFITIPFSAEKAWFLSTDQAESMRVRKEREALFKGQDEFKWRYVGLALKDPLVYLTGFTLFASTLPVLAFGTFLPTIILGFGYSALQVNYLTIPVYIAATISVAIVSFMSDKMRKRAVFLFLIPIPVLVGYAIAIGTPNNAAGYFAMFLCGIGIYPFNCVMLSWFSSNVSPDHKRSVGLAIAASIANVSGVLSGQIYPPGDAPRYISGNAVSLGLEFVSLVGVAIIYALLKWKMAAKKKAIQEGKESDKEGDGALDFVYTF
ncbi:high-affinity nicotinic acid transporter [Trichoderma arundinaceum]|uniref:High-affinity nicotinic acid transporter n=1 Tax=Trichoderma arundinaceum TaxID=490622 RepID=A0A395NF20_TRIAR|nr:high-affinity nicotinic acid transporter [Trichoderma arundinaceum]